MSGSLCVVKYQPATGLQQGPCVLRRGQSHLFYTIHQDQVRVESADGRLVQVPLEQHPHPWHHDVTPTRQFILDGAGPLETRFHDYQMTTPVSEPA
jgi:hypothetical protein